jgi:hypothetical protein
LISAFGLAVELALPVPELGPAVGHAVDERPPGHAVDERPPGHTCDERPPGHTCDERPPGHTCDERPPGPPVRVQLAEARQLEAAWSGSTTPPRLATATVDGGRWIAERGRAGDVRMRHRLGRFHLDAPGTSLLCAPTDESDPGWRRLLLDTALVTVSLARGFDALHAGSVVIGGQAVAIAGGQGAGKTSVLVELLRAGAGFLTDDILALAPARSVVMGAPGPPVANLPYSEAAGEVAEPLHRFGEEWWGRIRRPHGAPAPVGTVLVVERAEPGARAPLVEPVDQPVAPLLAHALDSGSEPKRRERRLRVLAQLAQSVEVLRLRVTGALPPRELVAELIEALPRLAP